MGAPTTLYLIEDNTMLAQALSQAIGKRGDLKLLGHSPTLEHAKAHAAASAAQIYLIDLGLPDGDGCEIISHLAQALPSSERLVFTVFGDESRLLQALQAGATGYVLKTGQHEDLLAAIDLARQGGSPVSPILARMLLKHFHAGPPPEVNASAPGGNEQPASAEDGTVEDDENGFGLTPKQTEVLRMIANGYVTREIAEELGISYHTVLTHIKSIYKKLNVTNRVQAANIARKCNLA